MTNFKYKVGDKLICIKTFYLGDAGAEYEKGISIEIHSINFGRMYPIGVIYDNMECLFTILEIHDNFVSLAEWRDIQINSILYD